MNHKSATMYRAIFVGLLVASALVSTSSPSSARTGSSSTKIWVGAPYGGYWPGSPNSTSSLPSKHNPTYTIYGHTYKGDWAMDYYQVAGTRAYVYAAPKDSSLNSAITAKVVKVGPACLSGVIGDGGYAVQVSLYDTGVRVGTVVYAHVNPDFNNDGATTSTDVNYRGSISRWGGYIGKIGAYRVGTTANPNTCWDVHSSGGQHVHIELSNEKNYACYRPGVAQHASIAVHEYIGYLGGAFATGPKTACPSGA